jgi:type IV pilus assembly protein PilC
VFASFGGELPAPTLIVIAISDYFTANWHIIFGSIYAVIYGLGQAFKRSRALQIAVDKYSLKVPVFGDLIIKSSIARWTRTLSTMFAAGVPLVDALDSVGGAAGNYAIQATEIQAKCDRVKSHGSDGKLRRVPPHGHADGRHRRGIRPA